jgi:endoglucanase
MNILRIAISLVLLIYALASASPGIAADKRDFWKVQRAGANCFNIELDETWFQAARKNHIQFVRLAYSKWKSSAGSRDFLLGDADHYTGIPNADLVQLVSRLDMANKYGIKVIITPLSLPGGRWAQQTAYGKPDLRIWRDLKYQDQAAAFWKELASRLKNHPSVVGYNIINEPMPERSTKPPFTDSLVEGFKGWYDKTAHNTPADLNKFYRKVTSAIRQVDKETPVVLDSGQYATVNAFDYLQPISDSAILYSFHQYEPAAYTNFQENKNRFVYPGVVISEDDKRNWNFNTLRKYLERVDVWAKKNRVPATRILVGEFGVNRKNPGAAEFLADNIAAFNRFGWHWAFYSFREDTWQGMDYELGSKLLSEGANKAIHRSNNPIFQQIWLGLNTVWRKNPDPIKH